MEKFYLNVLLFIRKNLFLKNTFMNVVVIIYWVIQKTCPSPLDTCTAVMDLPFDANNIFFSYLHIISKSYIEYYMLISLKGGCTRF